MQMEKLHLLNEKKVIMAHEIGLGVDFTDYFISKFKKEMEFIFGRSH